MKDDFLYPGSRILPLTAYSRSTSFFESVLALGTRGEEQWSSLHTTAPSGWVGFKTTAVACHWRWLLPWPFHPQTSDHWTEQGGHSGSGACKHAHGVLNVVNKVRRLINKGMSVRQKTVAISYHVRLRIKLQL